MILVVMLVAAAVTPAFVNAGPNQTVSAVDVADLEQSVTLPKGAHRLADYARYYTAESLHHRRVLRGYFVLKGPDTPGSYLRESPVIVADGGCSVVTVYFDLKTRRVAGAVCNGLA